MNQDQLTAVLRVVVPAVCAWMASQGFTVFGDNGLVLQLTAALIAIAAVAWTFIKHTDAAKLQSAAAVDPGVKISIPPSVMAEDKNIAALVKNPDVPNVTAK
jgi:hypothetical protein